MLVSFTTLVACGGGYFNAFVKDNGYNFLDPVLINLKEENPLYDLSASSAYGYDQRAAYFDRKSQELNIIEWYNYLEKRLSKKELRELFYGEHNSLTQRYENIAKKLNDTAFEKYLHFVDYQSSFVSTLESKEDPLNIRDKSEALLKTEKDNFLKLRYLFLTMRLSHYAQDYQNVLVLYKTHYDAVKEVDSMVFEWIDALRAGALQHLGKDVESNLLYGEILKNHKTNAHLGYYDFKVENDTQWKNLLAQVKTKEDKALFYFLRALKWEGVPLIEHRELLKVAPNSIWFERLSYLIMQDFQNRSLDEESIDKNDKYELSNYKSYLEQTDYFVTTLSMLKKPTFFSLYSKMYMHIKEQKELDSLPERFETLATLANDKQQLFVDMLRYLHGVRAITQTQKGDNETLFLELARLLKEAPASKRESIFAYTAHYMAKLYPKNSSEERFSKHCSVIQSVGYSYIEGHMDTIAAEDFERYVEKKNRSYYEEKVFRVVMSSLAKNDVAKFLTLLYTKDGNFEKANHYLKQVPTLNRKTAFNPFNVSLSGNNRKVKGKGYEQKKFVETMLKIRQSLDKNPTSAMDHYLYANGLYNSSWFGNFPMAGSVDRSVTHFSNAEAQHILKNFEKIEEEYQLAQKYAVDPEFKAKIAYQLLKVEYNRFIIAEEEDRYGVYVSYFESKKLLGSKTFSSAIEKYKKNYSSTQYGKEIIRKCATFKYFK